MRVAIAGAGAVGRSIARELLENGHEVLLIDQKPSAIKVDSVPRAEWLLADACEISSLDDAALDRCHVVVAATGDDKVNLVVSLLAKTEYGVPRVVARVNHPGNEWLYNESWGIDVAVSTPRLLSALVEEAVSVGDLVRLMTFGQSEASLVELTMPADAPLAGQQVGSIEWPADAALVAILREGRVLVPQPQDPLQAGDELFFVTSQDVEEELERPLRRRLSGGHGVRQRGLRAALQPHHRALTPATARGRRAFCGVLPWVMGGEALPYAGGAGESSPCSEQPVTRCSGRRQAPARAPSGGPARRALTASRSSPGRGRTGSACGGEAVLLPCSCLCARACSSSAAGASGGQPQLEQVARRHRVRRRGPPRPRGTRPRAAPRPPGPPRPRRRTGRAGTSAGRPRRRT